MTKALGSYEIPPEYSPFIFCPLSYGPQSVVKPCGLFQPWTLMPLCLLTDVLSLSQQTFCIKSFIWCSRPSFFLSAFCTAEYLYLFFLAANVGPGKHTFMFLLLSFYSIQPTKCEFKWILKHWNKILWIGFIVKFISALDSDGSVFFFFFFTQKIMLEPIAYSLFLASVAWWKAVSLGSNRCWEFQ